MLTVRFSELSIGPGTLFLDAGAGFGRHAFEAARLGAQVVALDYAHDEVIAMRATFSAMYEAGEIKAENLVGVLRGDATCLPFADNIQLIFSGNHDGTVAPSVPPGLRTRASSLSAATSF